MLATSNRNPIKVELGSSQPFEDLTFAKSETVTADPNRKLCVPTWKLHRFMWVSQNDPLYLDLMAKQVARTQKKVTDVTSAPKPLEGGVAEIGKITNAVGIYIEQIARLWINSQIPVFEKRSYLYEVQDHRSKTRHWHAGENDIVTVSDGIPDIIFEVKCGGSKNVLHYGRAQLRRRVAVIGNVYPHIGAAVLNVIPENPPYTLKGFIKCEGLKLPINQLVESLRDGQIPKIQLPFCDLVEFGEQYGVSLDREILQAYQALRGFTRQAKKIFIQGKIAISNSP